MGLKLLLRTIKKSSFGFFHNDGFLAAKALSFQTLFCLLPSFLLILFISSYLGVFQSPLIQVETFLTDTFVPKPFKSEILKHINIAFEHSKSVFTIVFFIFLISSFSLMTDIHDAFYHLSYKTPRKKMHLFQQFAIYLYIIFGSLIVLLFDFFLGTFLTQLQLEKIPHLFARILGFLFTVLILYGLYNIMSPIKIYKRHNIVVSSFITSILFGGQKLFLIYLHWFPGYMLVYGAIATLPILFFWVYLHWIIILNGFTLLLESSSLRKTQIKQNDKILVSDY